jgi:hypothetical protein
VGNSEVCGSEVLAVMKLEAMTCHDGSDERWQEGMVIVKSVYPRWAV